MNPLILGYGNPLRSDDGFGWKAAQAIEAQLPLGAAEVVSRQQLTPELVEVIVKSSRVLFLDASHDGQPGEIRMAPISRDLSFQPAMVSHHLSPPSLLALAYYYRRSEIDATLLTVTGENFELGEELSPSVKKAWKPFLSRVLEWVRGV